MLRFVGVVILNFIDPALLLSIYAAACSLFSILTAVLPGNGGVGSLFALFWFESICYPVSILATHIFELPH
jgi:FHS family L-fucose permease-like MFS transporter